MNKEYLTIEEMNHISNAISKQKGQKYPCSNQIVTCGFFASKEEWEKFCNINKHKIKYTAKDCIGFEDGEKWRWYPDYNTGSIRGFRFYKIKVSRDINKQVFLQGIYPCCAIYCKEIEWI